MRGNIIDLLGLLLLIGAFVAGLVASSHRVLLVISVVAVGAAFGYIVQLQDPSDPPAMNAFFIGLMFLIDVLAAMFVRFIFLLVWHWFR